MTQLIYPLVSSSTAWKTQILVQLFLHYIPHTHTLKSLKPLFLGYVFWISPYFPMLVSRSFMEIRGISRCFFPPGDVDTLWNALDNGRGGFITVAWRFTDQISSDQQKVTRMEKSMAPFS